ncbi:hypothetical protein ACVRY5_05990 [Streptococcus ilei]|jgi:hypothetical protein|uniref:Uncharacterized protein n=1 Tax=Streptococcus koreensis TaxID=2382163 RepID=A0ABN5PX06_9STRE|nr:MULTISPECIES: hypothetical protein [Streptococcus]AGY38658.1 hypothetical protein N597_06760 [Streptococcus ilei]AGY40140.1 hypothetical protein N596_04905 [Streptococcus ilei]AYF94121.1 hypothetical protein D7D50_05730 [Streptococcus koreensis]MDB8650360.1 hypothetical protein [Streptococcus australis]MTQ42022.1 hypothetical protein [Streptococcus sp. BIOML-A1]
MDKEFLKNKIEALRHDFVESTSHERAVGFLDEARMSKKMIKIKKKLVSLEMERSQKKIEHKDLTKIDQKIQEQKQLFEDCCNQRSGG